MTPPAPGALAQGQISRCRITTGARLHFGLLAWGRTTQRNFGGLGVMVDEPALVLKASTSESDVIVADAEFHAVLSALVAKYRSRAQDASRQRPVRLELCAAMPRHAGFGSGTQLALSVGAALSLLERGAAGKGPELALLMGRGARSALGLHGFELGGLLLEAGKRTAEQIGPLISRCNVPDAWRFVLITRRDRQGLDGHDEQRAFTQLPAMPLATTERLCRLAATGVLPAAFEADFDGFARSLHEFGILVGEHFSSVQGGPFRDPSAARLAARLLDLGYPCVAQTSWGPTLVVPCANQKAAEQLHERLAAQHEAAQWQAHTSRPLNRGATIEAV
jgi:beta-RFAP synthase